MLHQATVKTEPRFKSSSTCPYKGDNCTPGKKKVAAHSPPVCLAAGGLTSIQLVNFYSFVLV